MGRTLYMARVDPHLTAACEVALALDIEPNRVAPLEAVQLTFLRRILGLNPRCVRVVLFSETGLWPLRYRRAQLALRYLKYLLQGPLLVSNALQEALQLAHAGYPSWISDLVHVLHELPVPVPFTLPPQLTDACVDEALGHLRASLVQHLELGATPERLPLLAGRVEYSKEKRVMVHRTLAFRDYLHVEHPAHRRALTRLIASDHPFAIEQLRRLVRFVPREDRVCRFCRLPGVVETEAHVLIDCADPRLTLIREEFMSEAFRTVRALVRQRRNLGSVDFLKALLSRRPLYDRLGEYVHEVFTLCGEVPLEAADQPA